MEVVGGVFFLVVAFCGIAWGLTKKETKPKVVNIAIKTHEEHDNESDRKYWRAVAKMREIEERLEREQAMKDGVVLRSTQFWEEGK
jgi:hypothetical protein